MTLTRTVFERNAILRQLKDDDAAAVLADGEVVRFNLRQPAYDLGQVIEDVYFPLSAVLSIVNHMNDGSIIEIGTIGCEGMSGTPLIMGSATSRNDIFCQVGGDAWRMSASTFRALLAGSARFRALTNRYLLAYIDMLGQLTSCNRLHTIFERTARWILVTRDRVGESTFPLTHEFLSIMLGCRRSGVTIAAATLQKAGFITYRRGRITIQNDEGLEGATCECYGITKRAFESMLGPAFPIPD